MKFINFTGKKVYLIVGLLSALILHTFLLLLVRQANIDAYSTFFASGVTLACVWLGYQYEQRIKFSSIKAVLSVDFKSYIQNVNLLVTDLKPILERAIKDVSLQQELIGDADVILNSIGNFYRSETDNWEKNKYLFVNNLSESTYENINKYVNKVTYIQLQIDLIRKNVYEQQAKKAEFVIQKVVNFSINHPVSQKMVAKIIEGIEEKNPVKILSVESDPEYMRDLTEYKMGLNGFLFRVQPEPYAYRTIYYYQELYNSLCDIHNIDKEIMEFDQI